MNSRYIFIFLVHQSASHDWFIKIFFDLLPSVRSRKNKTVYNFLQNSIFYLFDPILLSLEPIDVCREGASINFVGGAPTKNAGPGVGPEYPF